MTKHNSQNGSCQHSHRFISFISSITVLTTLLLSGCSSNKTEPFAPYIGYNEKSPLFYHSNNTFSTMEGLAEQNETEESSMGETEPVEIIDYRTEPVILKGYTKTSTSDHAKCILVQLPELKDDKLDEATINTFKQQSEELKNGDTGLRDCGVLARLMTAYIICKEHALSEKVVCTKQDFGETSVKTIGIKDHDVFTVRQLIYAMFVASASDAAYMLAQYDAGSIDAFVTKMNQEAKELGALDTSFADPAGLTRADTKESFSTPYDQYLIAQKALYMDGIVDAISISYYTDSYTNEDFIYSDIEENPAISEEKDNDPNAITFEWINDNQYVNDVFALEEGLVRIGGITGNTDKSGYCSLLYFMDSDTNRYVAIVLHASEYEKVYGDMAELLQLCND